MTLGATPQDWQRLVDAGLTEDLLPVVSDTTVPIHPDSKLKALGKTPSTMSGEHAVGIAKWTAQRSRPRQIEAWAADPRLGVCIQTRHVRAIDIDIDDPQLAMHVRQACELILGAVPVRSRPNSGKCLLAFALPGDHTKRIIRVEGKGLIEFLATGQQFIAHGTHPSGVRYEWERLDVIDVLGEFPEADPDDLELLWSHLADQHGGSVDARAGAKPSAPRRAQDVNDDVVQHLEDAGWVRGWGSDGRVHVTCPWKDGHSGDSGETESAYFPAGLGGFTAGHYKCLHASCAHRTEEQFLSAVGYVEAQFDVVPEPSPEQVRQAQQERKKRRGAPGAHHLTTDQANAGRIIRRYGRQLIVMAGQWYAWTGTRWEKDEGEVYRIACSLSSMVHDEAKEWRAKPSANSDEAEKNQAIADALVKWAAKSEMKATIEAAVGLAKKLLAVDQGQLDRDPWLLNCINGTVDLRTGDIKRHDPADYITKLCPVAYVPDAGREVWEATIAKVTLESGMRTRPLARFLQRWFGYCATGSTREQAFVVHYGNGSNGKSTILDTVAEVLGDYAATAAPGLLVGSNKDRHPTELADLLGRRMVTAHESNEGGLLKEGLVKQLTGGDKIKGRFMRADFIEFEPIHKLQLLTNHKPVIVGQDNGIWRRVVLMPYLARFGTSEEHAAGAAHYVKDTRVAERLKAELEGVLAWVVEGARMWFTEGLQPPDVVLAASRDYQNEQDRIGQFFGDCCEVSPGERTALVGGMGGLYDAYRAWCGEAGTHPMSKLRFADEFAKFIPCRKWHEGREPGTRKKVRWALDVRLLG